MREWEVIVIAQFLIVIIDFFFFFFFFYFGAMLHFSSNIINKMMVSVNGMGSIAIYECEVFEF